MRKNLLGLFLILSLILSSESLKSQVLENGDAVATCFAWNATEYVAGIIKVQDADNQIPYQNWAAPMYHGPVGNKWTRDNLGQVFGIAIDNAGYIYLSAARIYNSTSPPGGPGGSGAIYKIDAVTGIPSVLVSTLNANNGSVIGTNTIPNTGVGLGNIAYDSDNDQIFATNFEDGMIYRIDANSGNILSRYDPFLPYGSTNGIVPHDERIWGIGIYNDRVYFGRWREDTGNQSATVGNEIWSIAIDPSGDFTGSEQLEFVLPTLSTSVDFSNPVADIAFDIGGRMLIAERTMTSNANNPFYPVAHQSRVLRYDYVGSSWVQNTSVYGLGLSINNSSGGVDFAYTSYDENNKLPIDCDSTIWATGDALKLDMTAGYCNECIYGIQRLGVDGDVATNSVMVDLDGILTGPAGTAQAKRQIGDVEVFKSCRVEEPNTRPCDEYRLSYQSHLGGENRTECCLDISLDIFQSDLFTNVQANVLTNDLTITGSFAPTGWGTGNNGLTATWTPNSGLIQAGQIDSLNMCMFSLAAPPQEVEIVLFAKDGTVCRDTIRLDCPQQEPPIPDCFNVREAGIECVKTGPDGNEYQYSVIITNNSPFSNSPYNLPAENVLVYSTTTGVSVVPNSMSFAPIGVGQSTGVLSFTLTGPNAIPGDSVCLEFQLHGATYGNDYQWCCPPVEICFELPNCDDCCEDFEFDINSRIRQVNNTNINLTGSLSAGPNDIIKANATIIAVARKPFGNNCPVNQDWESIHGVFDNPSGSLGGLNLISYPTPYITAPPPPYSEVNWGINPTGVTLNNEGFNLNLNLAAVPFKCRDSVRICIKYSFTDIKCRTCDTVICYDIVRTPKLIGKPIDFVLSKGLFELKLNSFTDGTLRLGLDGIEDVVWDLYRISKVKITPKSGINITSVIGPNQEAIEVRDRRAEFEGELDVNKDNLFELSFDNPDELVEISLDLEIEFRDLDSDNDGILDYYTVNGRVQISDFDGKRVLGEDTESDIPDNIHTYVLYAQDYNSSRSNKARGIAFIDIIIDEDEDVEILAVGTRSKQGITLQVYNSDEDNKEAAVSGLPTGKRQHKPLNYLDEIRPIFITISSPEDKEVRLLYKTYDSEGLPLNESELTLVQPVSSIFTNSDEPGDLDVRITGVFPNPTSKIVTVNFYSSKNMNNMTLSLYDASGNLVENIFANQTVSQGNHTLNYTNDNLVSGVYYLRLSDGERSETKIINIIK